MELLVNYKNHPAVEGEKGIEFAKSAHGISKQTGVRIGIVLPFEQAEYFFDRGFLPKNNEINLPRIAWFIPGPTTFRYRGCDGALINHSEHPVPQSVIPKQIAYLRMDAMIAYVCANTAEEAVRFAEYNPTGIMYEPKELVGTGNPVSKLRRGQIEEIAEAFARMESPPQFYIGAGINDVDAVEAAFMPGVEGVLVSKGILDAPDTVKRLQEFADAIARVKKIVR